MMRHIVDLPCHSTSVNARQGSIYGHPATPITPARWQQPIWVAAVAEGHRLYGKMQDR
jgi:hypothetical protein